MSAINNQAWFVIAAVVILTLVVAGVCLFFYRQKQSRRLQQRFGPEYRRAVDELGRTKAEAELRAREKRVEKLHIAPLAPQEVADFSQRWRAIQGRFVDSPKGAVIEADKLVRELMQRRGYPMGDFERRAGDISVDHPNVVENYRAAQAIATRAGREQADTEELRKAVVHYRVLFAELLEVAEPKHEITSDRHIEVRA
jgi:hypothetical protein